MAFTASSNGRGRRIFTRSLFGWNSKRIICPPDRSYSVRSEFSTNSSASLSLFSVGSFFNFFLIVFNLLPVHVAGAQGADKCIAAFLAQGEDDQHRSSCICPSNRLKPFLDPRMGGIGEHRQRPAEQALDRGLRNAVFLAFLPIALVPVESSNV